MKILNLILAVFFLLFAFLQINDPDPVVWILIYGAVAVTCILAAFRQYYLPVLMGLIVVLAAYSLVFLEGVIDWLQSPDKSLLFDNIAKMQYPYIEESREFLGLLICVLVLVMHVVQSRKRVKA